MLSIGIVGLPNVGKSTLFKALTKKQIDIQNYPFTTIDPNVGVVTVPDERLEALASLSSSKKIVPTYIDFIDIAGLVKGASAGEGLGNKFLANIREVNAIAHVVRVFENETITHVHKTIDPASDIETINTELIIADLDTVTRRLDKTKVNDPKLALEVGVLHRLKAGLEAGQLAINLSFDDKEAPIVRELQLLTNKLVIYVFNASEQQLKDHWQPDTRLLEAIHGRAYIILSSTFELLLSESEPADRLVFLEDIGLPESGLDQLIKESYTTLGLITFLTTGEDETRAWTTQRNTPIPKASTAIHTDFEKLFIKAEVINWRELLEAGSWSKARQIGKLRTVGKDYIVQDGDVVEIKI